MIKLDSLALYLNSEEDYLIAFKEKDAEDVKSTMIGDRGPQYVERGDSKEELKLYEEKMTLMFPVEASCVENAPNIIKPCKNTLL